MTPIKQYEAQQRALETERAEQINADLQRDALASHHYADGLKVEWNEPTVIKVTQPEAANFCAAYDAWQLVPTWLVWMLRVAFALTLTAVFLLAGLWIVS